MALTIEDGSIVADADSFITVAEADTILANYGKDASWDKKSIVEKEVLLRNAGSYLNTNYCWLGCIVSAAQEMAWPRSSVYVCDFLVASDDIPTAIKRAQAFLAAESIDNALFSTSVPASTSGTLLSETVKVGPLSIAEEYDRPGSDSDTQVKFTEVDKLLKDFVEGTSRKLGRS